MMASTVEDIIHHDWLWIDGRRVPARGEGFADVISPATEQVIATVRTASCSDVDEAVLAAKRAMRNEPWAKITMGARMAVLERARQLLLARRDEFARLQTNQMGAPFTAARNSITKAAANLQSTINAALKLPIRFLLRDSEGSTLVDRQPVGVVAAIVPWNSPTQFEVDKVSAALAAGCAVVLKPAPETPLGAFLLAQVFADAGLPNGMLNIVTGDAETGQWMTKHPDVARVTFTGSSAVGLQIAEQCARALKRVSLELGGKSAAIVLEDADIAATAPVLARSNFGNSGQACHALTRVLVHRSRRDELVDAVADIARRLRVGDPHDMGVEMGPLVSRGQRDRVEGYLELARSEGACIAVGGRRPTSLSRGWYFQPTVLTGVTNSMTVAREEIFGPVMSVIEFGDVDDAVAIANDSPYGLGGGVFTADPSCAVELAARIETGMVSINGWGMTRAAPFGGVKRSGIGREHGMWGVADSWETHSIRVPDQVADQLAAAGVGSEAVLI